MPDTAAHSPQTGQHGDTLTIMVTALAYFMVTLDGLVAVVTPSPSIHRDLGGTISTLQWTVIAFSTAFTAGMITAAALGDRLGLLEFTATSAACAPNSGTRIAFRALQGTAAAIIVPLSLILLTSALPARRRPRGRRRRPRCP
jgi:MFS family permease